MPRKPKAPDFKYYEDAVPEPDKLYWDLLEELYRSKSMQHVKMPNRSTIACYQERQRAGLNPQSVIQRLEEGTGMAARGRPRFTPTVGILAGLAWAKTGILFDAAQLALYRDGDDWVGPHTDYEGLFGPEPDNVVVAIFSFGATRRLGFHRMGLSVADLAQVEDEPDLEVNLKAGSMFLMRGVTQRHWLHQVMREQDLRLPRLSVSLVCYPSEERDPAAMLLEARDGGAMQALPRFVGTPHDCARAWQRIVDEEGLHEGQLSRFIPDELKPEPVEGAPELGMVLSDGTDVTRLLNALVKYAGERPSAPPGVDPDKFMELMKSRYGDKAMELWENEMEGAAR